MLSFSQTFAIQVGRGDDIRLADDVSISDNIEKGGNSETIVLIQKEFSEITPHLSHGHSATAAPDPGRPLPVKTDPRFRKLENTGSADRKADAFGGDYMA